MMDTMPLVLCQVSTNSFGLLILEQVLIFILIRKCFILLTSKRNLWLYLPDGASVGLETIHIHVGVGVNTCIETICFFSIFGHFHIWALWKTERFQSKLVLKRVGSGNWWVSDLYELSCLKAGLDILEVNGAGRDNKLWREMKA